VFVDTVVLVAALLWRPSVRGGEGGREGEKGRERERARARARAREREREVAPK